MADRGVYRDSYVTDSLQQPFGTSGVFSKIVGICKSSLTITPAAVAAGTTAEQIFPLGVAQVGDIVLITPPSALVGYSIAGVRVSSASNVAIAFSNPTAGALTPTAGTYTLAIIR